MRNQPNVRHESAPASVVSDKKARREARKMEVKQQKKAEKQKKRENKMDEEEKWSPLYSLIGSNQQGTYLRMNFSAKHEDVE